MSKKCRQSWMKTLIHVTVWRLQTSNGSSVARMDRIVSAIQRSHEGYLKIGRSGMSVQRHVSSFFAPRNCLRVDDKPQYDDESGPSTEYRDPERGYWFPTAWTWKNQKWNEKWSGSHAHNTQLLLQELFRSAVCFSLFVTITVGTLTADNERGVKAKTSLQLHSKLDCTDLDFFSSAAQNFSSFTHRKAVECREKFFT